MHELVRWEFHHFYCGKPHYHLLTMGWSRFVNTKLLVAGDANQMGSSCLSGYAACLATSSSFQRGFRVICFCKEEKLPSIYGYGFEKCSAIQQRAVLPIITGRDVIAQAQSETGKTYMILLSVCQIIDANVHRDEFLG